MNNIVVFPSLSRFPIELISCIALGSSPLACFLLKSIATNLYCSLKYKLSSRHPVVQSYPWPLAFFVFSWVLTSF